ncbi:transcriptional regulator, MarR family [Kribbella flavida DSM 17836]|uniref:Transcriptional regulator, MarR family n=1 Tax=Kribbella flavida (strain DSM 17836 / JCM 10339 / NBRC 14399) TaxID=479435 RepID=D2PY32_KRIFD|nr:MarR family transcriptional regulator [Kribbella flavida]ADB33638.1 transcriptional regulator, MarR family [Kribbella flavida DSM 17836]
MQETLGAASSLVRLTFLVQSLYAEVGRGCDLTQAQAQMLCSLAGRSVGMAELSATLGVERSSLTGLVDRAEHRGLVVRHQDAKDRRAVKVSLTEDGNEALQRFHRELTDRLELMLAELPDGEREQFTGTLRRIVADAPAVFADEPQPKA